MEKPNVSLWLDPNHKTYAGRDVIRKGTSYSIVSYSGSKTRHLNDLIGAGNKLIVKEGAEWVTFGIVLMFRPVDDAGLKIFELVVENIPAEKFRTKADVCARFGWKPVGYPKCLQGIIQHEVA